MNQFSTWKYFNLLTFSFCKQKSVSFQRHHQKNYLFNCSSKLKQYNLRRKKHTTTLTGYFTDYQGRKCSKCKQVRIFLLLFISIKYHDLKLFIAL
jgi:hypothetical protein